MLRFVAPFIETDEARKTIGNAYRVQKTLEALRGLKTADLSLPTMITLPNPENIDTAETFEKISFVISDRWEQHGVTWVASTRFAISLDSMIVCYESLSRRMMEENINYLASAITE